MMNRGVRNGQTLRFERRLAHSIDKVWHVLTDEAETAYWFPGKIVGRREVGAKVRFEFGPKPPGVITDDFAALIDSRQAAFDSAPDSDFEGTIEAFDPPRVFALTWAGDRLRFELETTTGGTLLVFTYTFPAEYSAEVAAGWHTCLDWLANRTDHDATPTTLAQFKAIEAEYE